MSNMEQRINFLNKVSSVQKPTNVVAGLQDLETMRFFNESPTKIRLQKARQSHKSMEPSNNQHSPQNSPVLGPAKEPREPLDHLIKAYTKVSKKYKEQNVNMLDIRGMQKLEEFHFNDEHIFPAKESRKLSPTLYKDSSPLSNRRSRKTSTNISSSPLLPPSYKSSYRNDRDSPISNSKAPSVQDSGIFMSMGGSDFKLKSLGSEDFKKRLSNRKSSVGGSGGVIVPQLMLNKHSSVGNLEDDNTPANSIMKPKGGLYTPSVRNMGFLSPSSEMSSFTMKSPVGKKAINLKLGNNRGVVEVSDWRKRVFQRTPRGGDSARGSSSISPKKYHH